MAAIIRWWRRAPFLVAGLMVLLSGCSAVQTTSSGAVGVGRTQYLSDWVTPSMVDQEAAASYRQTLSEASAGGALNRQSAEVLRVRAITDRLIAQVPAFRPDAVSWDWQINVIDSPEVNAWCMPGGRMAIYTGFLNTIQPTDDELAAVMGHEIAHALREHTREKMTQQLGASVGLTVLGLVTGSKDAMDLGDTLTQVMFTLPNSREFESESDAIGVELAALAGYDPRAAVTLWQKMGAVGGGRPPELLSTHPSPESRIRELQQLAQKVMPIYEAKRNPEPR